MNRIALFRARRASVGWDKRSKTQQDIYVIHPTSFYGVEFSSTRLPCAS